MYGTIEHAKGIVTTISEGVCLHPKRGSYQAISTEFPLSVLPRSQKQWPKFMADHLRQIASLIEEQKQISS